MTRPKSTVRPQAPRVPEVAKHSRAAPPLLHEASQPSRLVFKPEVLDRVGVTYPTIWQWMREGKFPRSREVGGKVAWLETEIDQWIATRPLRQLKRAEA